MKIGLKFEVGPSCSRLRALSSEDDHEWELVSCEVPVVPAVGLSKQELDVIDHVASLMSFS